jgi:capsular polysaccharide biosynthesis protein/MinD-like ATPase involved in chromosome partitioning or flagellar assembly
MGTDRKEPLEFSDYAAVPKRRWRWVLILTVVCLLAAGLYAKASPKKYTSTALVEVSAVQDNTNAVGGRTSGSVNMDNEAQIAQSVAVASAATKRSHSNVSPEVWAGRISVAVPPNTTFLQISCTTSTARSAQLCAQTTAEAFLSNRLTTAATTITAVQLTDQSRLSGLQTSMQHLRGLVGRLPKTSPKRPALLSQIHHDQSLAGALSTQLNDGATTLANLSPAAVGGIVTPATRPSSASSPRLRLLLPSGLVAGLVLGLIAAFVVEARDRRLRQARDVERYVGLPVLADLTSISSKDFSRVVSDQSETARQLSVLAQELGAALNEPNAVLVVASTSRSYGNGLVAANLAATLARTRGPAVLVLTGGSASPVLGSLGVEPGAGLAEVLSGAATLEAALVPAPGIARLTVLGPGEHREAVDLGERGPLLAEYATLVSELQSLATYVVIEVDASRTGDDAFGLCEFGRFGIVTVEAKATRNEDAERAIDRLERLGLSLRGAVLAPVPSAPSRHRPDATAVRQVTNQAPALTLHGPISDQPLELEKTQSFEVTPSGAGQ